MLHQWYEQGCSSAMCRSATASRVCMAGGLKWHVKACNSATVAQAGSY